MEFPPEEECHDFDEPGEPSTRALRDLLRLVPRTIVHKSQLDMTRLTEEERTRLKESADEVLTASIQALTAIGGLLDWSVTQENRPCEIYSWRLGLLLQMIGELMTLCREVEETDDSDGG